MGCNQSIHSKAPEWHSSTEQEVESQSTFKAPEWNPPIDQEIAQQPSFKPPQFMPAEQLQVSENYISANARA